MPDRGNALGSGRSGEAGGEREGVCFLVSVQLRYAVQSEASMGIPPLASGCSVNVSLLIVSHICKMSIADVP